MTFLQGPGKASRWTFCGGGWRISSQGLAGLASGPVVLHVLPAKKPPGNPPSPFWHDFGYNLTLILLLLCNRITALDSLC